MVDLSSGCGENLNCLFELLEIKPDEQQEAARKIKALAEVYPDAPTFAQRVTELYIQ